MIPNYPNTQPVLNPKHRAEPPRHKKPEPPRHKKPEPVEITELRDKLVGFTGPGKHSVIQ